MRRLPCVWLIVLGLAGCVSAQDVQVLSPGLRKLSGMEPTQKIEYARIFLDGVLVAPGAPAQTQPLISPDGDVPVLIAQCTKGPSGRFRFELMMNFGKIADTSYHPPWKSSGPGDLFPPRTQRTPMIFDFFGYTRVKPVKRNWELVLSPDGELRYDTPGSGSRNLEEIMFYLQYLKALPTLRITRGNVAAQFETTPLLTAIHQEPLCAASGV